MNTLIVFSLCLLALATAGPDLTPQQKAQYDVLKAQSLARLSPAGQQAQMRMDQLDQQIDSYYQSLPQSTRAELDANYNQLQMQMRTLIGMNNYNNNNNNNNNNGMGYFRK